MADNINNELKELTIYAKSKGISRKDLTKLLIKCLKNNEMYKFEDYINLYIESQKIIES